MGRKRIRSGLGGLFLPLFLITILIVVVGVIMFPDWQKRKFGSSDRFNVVFADNSLTLVSYDLQDNSMVVSNFPPDLYLQETYYGYGGYPAKSIYSVGELDKRGGETAQNSVGEYLAVPVDGYIKSSFYGPKSFNNIRWLLGRSNLWLGDRVMLIYRLFMIRFDKVKTVNLDKISTPLLLADGSVVSAIESLELDNSLSGVFVEDNLTKENLRVAVVNTTNVLGLAARAVRTLSNIGLSVINVDNQNARLLKCAVSANEKYIKSKTANRIAKIYDCEVTINNEQTRSDVTLMLGETYAKSLGKL